MAITIKAKFKCSSEKISQVPKDDLKDIAFIGRSNVGKSSLVNMLTGIKGLAKVSGTPGKTRLINHFLVNDSWYLVDLPGYGYAKVSKETRGEFSKIILDYVLKCQKMHFLFVLVDSRLEPQKIDLNFIELLGENGVPFGIIFTKADKLSQAQLNRNITAYKRTLSEQWEVERKGSWPRGDTHLYRGVPLHPLKRALILRKLLTLNNIYNIVARLGVVLLREARHTIAKAYTRRYGRNAALPLLEALALVGIEYDVAPLEWLKALLGESHHRVHRQPHHVGHKYRPDVCRLVGLYQRHRAVGTIP